MIYRIKYVCNAYWKLYIWKAFNDNMTITLLIFSSTFDNNLVTTSISIASIADSCPDDHEKKCASLFVS